MGPVRGGLRRRSREKKKAMERLDKHRHAGFRTKNSRERGKLQKGKGGGGC